MSAVDKNRGVTIRLHPQGFRVCQYKDQPGAYFDASGNALPEKVAEAAGFDIGRDAKERLKQAKIAEARAKIEAEFAAAEEAIEEEVAAEIEGRRFRQKHLQFGKWTVVDEDGKQVTKKQLTKDEAKALAEQMNSAPAPTGQQPQEAPTDGDDEPTDEGDEGGSDGTQA